MATYEPARIASLSGLEVNLVIAVCVLGTLVGVGLVVVVALVLLRTDCCSVTPWRWTSITNRRSRKSRTEIELENLAGGAENFITDSMLPGNRTGASENLGLRSPNHCRIPALRIPDDFSPSPPFPPEVEQGAKPKLFRDRLPSPNKSRRLTVLNTLVPNTLDGTVRKLGAISGTNPSKSKKSKTIEFKGEYDQIPSSARKPLEHFRSRPEANTKRSNARDSNWYPVSDDEADDQCKGFGHSYYKPGGFSSYIPQNIFDAQKSRHNPRGSSRRSSYSVYSKIPSCSESDDDSRSREMNIYTKRGSRGVCEYGVMHETLMNPPSKNRKRLPPGPSSLNRQQATVDEESPPLASSSRNTSVDGSKSTSQRYDSLDRKQHQYPMRSSQSQPSTIKRVLERRHQNLVSNKNSSGMKKKSKDNVHPLRSEVRRASLEAAIDHHNTTADDEVSRIISTSRAVAQFAQVQEGRVEGQTSYILANTLVTEGPNIWIESAPRTDSRSPSFRRNSPVASNSRPACVYQSGRSALTDPHGESSKTLPSQHSSRSIGRVSLLYHISPHSSSQSLRPTSKVMEESSTFGKSKSVQMSSVQTPPSFRKQIISSDKSTHDPNPSTVLESGLRREDVDPLMNYSFRDEEKSCISQADNEGTDEDMISQVLPSQPRSTSSSPSSPPPPAAGAVALTADGDGNTARAHSVKEASSLLDSRDIVDPTTASMSWDHLTPDPSPVYNIGFDGNHESHYTPNCIKTKSRSSHDSPRSEALSDVYSSFADTFARQYELRPFKKLSSSSDLKIDTSTFLPAALPAEINEDARLFRKRESLRKQAKMLNACSLAMNCASLETTRGRQNVNIQPSNITSRFNEGAEASRVFELKPEGSFSDSLFPLKKLLSSTENSLQKESLAPGSAPTFLKEAERRDSRNSVMSQLGTISLLLLALYTAPSTSLVCFRRSGCREEPSAFQSPAPDARPPAWQVVKKLFYFAIKMCEMVRLSLLVLLVSVTATTALECYKCSSCEEGERGDPIECSSSQTACLKAVLGSHIEKTCTRNVACQLGDVEKSLANFFNDISSSFGASSDEDSNSRVMHCCDTDYCNGGSALGPATVALLLPPLLITALMR
ncbi:hypothetical protein FHG87_007355 [Trinorchestia longiramus]|nr:hypothetical protein FHG87_007355 [Trinorchestia longiramus]